MSNNTKRVRNVGTNTDMGANFTWNKSASSKQPPGLKERSVHHIRLSESSDLRDIYSFGREIGQGGFATVVSIVDKQTEQNWALKIVNKAAVGERIDTVYREINILKMVDHPHIIYLEKVFESKNKIYLVLELCYNTLASIYKELRPFAEKDARKIIRDLTSAVLYLHKHDIAHRDLKLENILIAKNPDDVDDKFYIKITDFGLSIIRKGTGYENMLHECCGTLVYMAPEIITSHSYSQQCDVWAIGVIMYMLLAGSLPFYSDNEEVLTGMICNNEPAYKRLPVTSEALDLITKLLNKNPALRATAAEVIQHPWIVGTKINDSGISENVLDMMRLWRSEMTLPVGDECDWVSEAKSISATNGTKSTIEENGCSAGVASASAPGSGRVSRKQSMHLAVKNIRFDRAGGRSAEQETRSGTSTQINGENSARTKISKKK